jgi:hypothetical protein
MATASAAAPLRRPAPAKFAAAAPVKGTEVVVVLTAGFEAEAVVLMVVLAGGAGTLVEEEQGTVV